MPDDSRSWRRSGPPGPRFEFDESTVVYNPLTGETHFLAELPALLYEQLSETGASLTELLARFAAEDELDSSAMAQISQALRQLEAADLIESSDRGTLPHR